MQNLLSAFRVLAAAFFLILALVGVAGIFLTHPDSPGVRLLGPMGARIGAVILALAAAAAAYGLFRKHAWSVVLALSIGVGLSLVTEQAGGFFLGAFLMLAFADIVSSVFRPHQRNVETSES